MSQILSKLDVNNNKHFGREMRRDGKEEKVRNVIAWLHQETSIRSCGKSNSVWGTKRTSPRKGLKKAENNTTDGEETDDNTCPLSCKAKHHLAACPIFKIITVNKKWGIVKQYWRYQKCLRALHTNECKKPDGSTCDKCRKNHHRSLHNDKANETITRLNPKAAPFQSGILDVPVTQNCNNVHENAVYQQKGQLKSVTGLFPVQKVKVINRNGNFFAVLAMLDSGSNTSLLFKNTAKKLGLKGSATHLTMNLAGGKLKNLRPHRLSMSAHR